MGSFPEQRLVIEPSLEANLKMLYSLSNRLLQSSINHSDPGTILKQWKSGSRFVVHSRFAWLKRKS